MLQEEMPVDCVPEKFTDEETLSNADVVKNKLLLKKKHFRIEELLIT